KVIPIPAPANWQNVVPTDINKFGQIVGYGFNGTKTLPFIATTNTFTPVPLPNERFLTGFGVSINDSGQIAGWGYYDSGFGNRLTQVFTGVGGTTEIVIEGQLYNYAFDINNSGEIAGDWYTRGIFCEAFHSFIRS